MDMNPRVLDATCGSRMMHFNKRNPDVVYADCRELTTTLCDGRILNIKPDIVCDFTQLPFHDGQFNLVIFDPPHLLHAGDTSWLRQKYGVLTENWRQTLTDGFTECLRVLDDNGTLIFKWAEDQIKISEVIKLAPIPPIGGHPSGRKGLTHFLFFVKPVAP
jgi:hypothetical protein